MAERNSLDILGFRCRFIRYPVGHRYSSGKKAYYCQFIHAVFLNDIFIGTIQTCTGNGWNFVALVPDNVCKVYRGSSRVKAVEDYIYENLF